MRRSSGRSRSKQLVTTSSDRNMAAERLDVHGEYPPRRGGDGSFFVVLGGTGGYTGLTASCNRPAPAWERCDAEPHRA